ncbi:DUF4244 domain-containing protein [Amycolatopsis palatopharyngis]|uniref:DUF4244 domain-containing protein n=1 Tax=Amycolatopsis palatopharyngis TaxID=187982 RepID=UPI000E256A95|nr:DUF4244 domain-containing protein [Amycolatopsis palatopharyngis]
MISNHPHFANDPLYGPAAATRWPALPAGDEGMSTAEYAIGTIAAAAFAALLYAVVTGDSVLAGLTALVERALSVSL